MSHVSRTYPVKTFRNRREAGRRLAAALGDYQQDKPLVLGLPRGGVPVAFEVARALDAPLDVWVVRKLVTPGHPELGMGAIAEGGGSVTDPLAGPVLGISTDSFEAIVELERDELERRSIRFRSGRPLPDVRGRTVIVVDDGVATGGTARAALRAIRARGPARLILAVPVGPRDRLAAIADEVDDVVCLVQVRDLLAVGGWYEDFSQTPDDEVIDLLRRARKRADSNHELIVDGMANDAVAAEPMRTKDVVLDVDEVDLHATLAGPDQPRGLVIFGHRNGSGRSSPRTLQVAEALQQAGIATLRLDLLTEAEAADARVRSDPNLLARRLIGAARWAAEEALRGHVPLGYFGAGTDAATALIAAAKQPTLVAAVIASGGPPALAEVWLARESPPTLFTVEADDEPRLVTRWFREHFRTAAKPATSPELGHAPGGPV